MHRPKKPTIMTVRTHSLSYALMSLYALRAVLGGLRVLNIILSKNPFNPTVHTYKATSAPIFASKFEKKISATNGLSDPK